MALAILTRRSLLATAPLLVAAPTDEPGAAPAEPEGYRTAEYRAAVPATVNGRPGLSTDEAAVLWRARAAVFIDTLPQPPRPPALPPGAIWQPRPRFDIPGSLWLADSGYGELPAVMRHWFDERLAEATGGDRGRTLVFYCLAQCWMSWNATRRAAAAGFLAARWYPDGTDGWAASGLPLEARDPLPRPPL
jgi:PQQ-dependent catabolism-associated CXXCW motif protein